MKQQSNRSQTVIILLCWAAYTAAYLGRLNFNAYIEPMEDKVRFLEEDPVVARMNAAQLRTAVYFA